LKKKTKNKKEKGLEEDREGLQEAQCRNENRGGGQQSITTFDAGADLRQGGSWTGAEERSLPSRISNSFKRGEAQTNRAKQMYRLGKHKGGGEGDRFRPKMGANCCFRTKKGQVYNGPDFK